MRFRPIMTIGLSAILAFSAAGCSKKTDQPASVERVMPDNWTREASVFYDELAKFLPDNAQLTFYSSYGSFTEFQDKLQKWFPEKTDLLKSALQNNIISKREDLFARGCDLQKGFALAVINDKQINTIYALTIDNTSIFQNWAAEYEQKNGNSVTSDTVDGWNLLIIHHKGAENVSVIYAVKDRAALVITPQNNPQIQEKEARDAAIAVIQQKKSIADTTDAADVHKRMGNAPFALIARPSNAAIPCKYAVFTLTPNDDKLSINGSTALIKDNPYVQQSERIFKGHLGKWDTPIAHLTKGNSVRLSFDPNALIEVAMSYASEERRKSINEIYNMLNQKLLGINFEQQVVNNLDGSISIALHGINAEKLTGSEPTAAKILSQDFSIYIPMKDAEKANAFFGKLEMLKNIIPGDLDKLKIETVDGDILHSIVEYEGKPVHISYAKGLISITTDSGWARMNNLYKSPDNSEDKTSFMGTKIAGVTAEITPTVFTKLLDTVCKDSCADISNLLSFYKYITTAISIEGTDLTLEINAEINK